MVNITALQILSRFISNKNIKPMKKWSTRFRNVESDGRKSWYLKGLIRQIKKILNIISGNDIIEMIKDTLTKKELDELNTSKFKSALTNLSEHYQSTPLKKRHSIMRPIKDANLKFNQVKRLGYKVSKHLWKSCSNSEERNKGGGSSIQNYLKQSVVDFLKEKSNIASNRLVRIKDSGTRVPARYLEENKTELYKLFPFSDQISKSTFFKYTNLNGEYKKPHRLTDLCEYCEQGIFLKKKIIKFTNEQSYNLENMNDNLLTMANDFTKKATDVLLVIENTDCIEEKESLNETYDKYKTFVDEIEDYQSILFHKNIALMQRTAYSKQLKNLEELRNKILIELDFKQKFVIGMSPRQVSREFYSQTMRTCLGFGVYYVSDEKIREINFNIISSNLEQDANAAVNGFRLLRMQQFFQEIEKDEYIVWSDCGKHFRNNEFVGYLLLELAESKKKVNLNFFGDKHGKNNRDAHFSNLSRFVHSESLVKRLQSSQDIVEAIQRRQLMANQNKSDLDKIVTTHCIAIDEVIQNRLGEFRLKKTLTIQNIESFYNYRTIHDDFKLVTSILSSENSFITLKIKSQSILHQNYQVLQQEIYEDEPLNFGHLHNKKSRINSALAKIRFEKARNDQIVDTPFYNFFSTRVNENANIGDNLRVIPNNCRKPLGPKSKSKKLPCIQCSTLCSYEIEMILHPTKSISQDDIIEELDLHGHPTSRKIEDQNGVKRNRTKVEAARELADHFIYAHNKTEPKFL